MDHNVLCETTCHTILASLADHVPVFLMKPKSSHTFAALRIRVRGLSLREFGSDVQENGRIVQSHHIPIHDTDSVIGSSRLCRVISEYPDAHINHAMHEYFHRRARGQCPLQEGVLP